MRSPWVSYRQSWSSITLPNDSTGRTITPGTRASRISALQLALCAIVFALVLTSMVKKLVLCTFASELLPVIDSQGFSDMLQGQEHDCKSPCATDGVCQISTVPLESTFAGHHEVFTSLIWAMSVSDQSAIGLPVHQVFARCS